MRGGMGHLLGLDTSMVQWHLCCCTCSTHPITFHPNVIIFILLVFISPLLLNPTLTGRLGQINSAWSMKSAAVKMSQALSNYHFLKHGTDTNAARGLIIDIEDNMKCPTKKRRTLTNASWVSRGRVKELNWDAASPDYPQLV